MTPARIPQPPTLRRLVLARSKPGADGHPSTGHLCLFPVDDDARASALDGATVLGFECPCGAVFDATCELSSYTTEHVKRCLNAFRPWYGSDIDPRRIK